MNISVNSAYISRVAELNLKFKKYTPLFDCDNTHRFGFKFDEDVFSIWYKSPNGRQTVTYPESALRRCEVRHDGYLLLFKDKHFLFLPITGIADNDEYLLALGELFSNRYSGFRFVVIDRPLLKDPEEPYSPKTPVSFDLSDSPAVIIFTALLAVIIATVFITMRASYEPIAAVECTVYSGIYQRHFEDSKGYIDLYFEDGSVFYIHLACSSSDLCERLDTLVAGQRLDLRINPNVEYVVEIQSGDILILDMDTAQDAMLQEANAFMWLGIVVCVMAAYLVIYGVYKWRKERKHRRQ